VGTGANDLAILKLVHLAQPKLHRTSRRRDLSGGTPQRAVVKFEFWRRSDEMASAFFGPGSFETASFDNEQVFDLEGLKGRLLSISYVPAEGESGYDAMLREAEKIFHKYQTGGQVTVEYDTKVYYGRLAPGH
jgi:hypothetical protein